MNWTTIVVSAIAAFGSTLVGRAARRTRRQERRDDFTTVSERQAKDIERLETRMGRQEERIDRQDATIRGQATAIGHLSGWIRALVLFIRVSGMEPPPAPPMPEEARPYLHDIGV